MKRHYHDFDRWGYCGGCHKTRDQVDAEGRRARRLRMNAKVKAKREVKDG